MTFRLSLATSIALGALASSPGLVSAQESDSSDSVAATDTPVPPPTPVPTEVPEAPPATPPPPPNHRQVSTQPPEERATPEGYIRVEPGQPSEDPPQMDDGDDDEVPGSAGPYDYQDQGGGNPIAENADFQTFRDALSPYGKWVYTADYGWIWQPDGESDDWRPYSDGEWDWSAYGWTWCGAEPWAWAPYHYGRWASINGLGWGWVPGYTWGPAWVSWRYGTGYVGWSPLGPGRVYGQWGSSPINYSQWNFTPFNRFYGGRVTGALLHASAVGSVWGQTSFANSFKDNGASYSGPHPTLVASATGHAVTPVAIHPITSVSQSRLGGLRGNTLNVVAPAFHSAAHPFASNGRIGDVAATAAIGNRFADIKVAQAGGVSLYRGAVPSGSQRFANSGVSGGSFSTYSAPRHAPSVSNGYGSYGVARPSADYGSSYHTSSYSGSSGSYGGGYHTPAYSGSRGYSAGYGGSYGGYHASPAPASRSGSGGSSHASSSHPSSSGGGGHSGSGGGRH